MTKYMHRLLLVAALLVAACDTTDEPETRDAAFVVTGDASSAFIVQFIDELSFSSTERIPWGTAFPAAPGLMLQLSATSMDEGQSVRVAILIDGEEVEFAESENGTEIGIVYEVPPIE